MSGEPKTHTLEEAIQLLGPDEVLLVGYCGWEGMQYSVVEESSVKFLTHTYGKWEDALTDRLDRKVVVRDDAAELRAALRRCSNLIQDFLDFGIAPVDRGPARHAVEAARAALAATEEGE